MVMEGTLEISYGKYTYILEEGDASLRLHLPHHVHAFEGQAAESSQSSIPRIKNRKLVFNYQIELCGNGWNIGQKRPLTKSTSCTLTETYALRGENSTSV